MVDLIRNFARIGIPVIALKGPAVGVTAYGDPSLRTFGDMDLLVSSQNLIPARKLLASLGFRPDYEGARENSLARHQHALEFSSGRAKVELHASLLSRHLRLDFDTDEIWRTARKIDCAGAEVLVLSPEMQFLFHCAHGAKHEWISVRWICGIAQLSLRLEPVDITNILSLASRTRCRRILGLGLHVAAAVLHERRHRFSPDAIVDESDIRDLGWFSVSSASAGSSLRLNLSGYPGSTPRRRSNGTERLFCCPARREEERARWRRCFASMAGASCPTTSLLSG